MIGAIVWLAVILLVVAGIATLAGRRSMTDEEYERQRQRGPGVGNALLAFHEILEPQRGQPGKARIERRDEADPGADPPEPDGGEGGRDQAGTPSRS